IRPYMHLKIPPFKDINEGFALMCSVYFREDDVGTVDFPNYLFCNWRYGRQRFMTSVIQQVGKVEIIVCLKDNLEDSTEFLSTANDNSKNVLKIPVGEWVDIAFTYS